MASAQDWAQLVDAVMVAHGRLDILFNKAAVSFPHKVEDITVDISDRELAIHANSFSQIVRLMSSEPYMKSASQIGSVSRALPTRAQNLLALFAALGVIRVKSFFDPTSKKVRTPRQWVQRRREWPPQGRP